MITDTGLINSGDYMYIVMKNKTDDTETQYKITKDDIKCSLHRYHSKFLLKRKYKS